MVIAQSRRDPPDLWSDNSILSQSLLSCSQTAFQMRACSLNDSTDKMIVASRIKHRSPSHHVLAGSLQVMVKFYLDSIYLQAKATKWGVLGGGGSRNLISDYKPRRNVGKCGDFIRLNQLIRANRESTKRVNSCYILPLFG